MTTTTAQQAREHPPPPPYPSAGCPVLKKPLKYLALLKAAREYEREQARLPGEAERRRHASANRWRLLTLFEEAEAAFAKQYPKLGSGYSRTVFDNGGCVFKLAAWETRHVNRREWDAWRRLQGTSRAAYFAPAIALLDDDLLLVMQKAEQVGHSMACRLLEEEGESVACSDLHPANVGFIDGRPVVIDYEYLDGEGYPL